MHVAIDIIAALVLFFFFLSGWHKGFLLSLLAVVRVVLAYGGAYYAGRYIGDWLGVFLYRPRIVMIPVTAGLAYVLIAFTFHILMWKIRKRHHEKEEKGDFHRPWPSSLLGGTITLSAGLFSMVFLFWLGDLFMTGVTGHSIPGADEAYFGRFVRRAVYEVAYGAAAKEGRESQAAAMARMISNPANGLSHLEKVLAASSVQQVLSDRQLAEDMLSGDPERIEQNASLQLLFNDREALEELRELGIVSGKETKSGFCENLARFGRNEKIRTSIENLQAKDLLRTDRILLLIRDPDFDVIVGELVK